jgi:hypothetical protein
MISRIYAALKGAPIDPGEKQCEALKESNYDLVASEPGTLERRDAVYKKLALAKRVFPIDPHLALTHALLAAKGAETESNSSWRPIAYIQARTIASIQQRAFADILEYTTDNKQIDLEYRTLSRDALSYIANKAPKESPEKIEARKRLDVLDLKQRCLMTAVARAQNPIRHILNATGKKEPAPL